MYLFVYLNKGQKRGKPWSARLGDGDILYFI